MENTERDVLWDLDSEWREINFLFHCLHKKEFFKPLLINSALTFTPNEKQIALNEFTSKVSTTLNSKDAAEFEINFPNKSNNREIKKGLLKYFKKHTIDAESLEWITPEDSYLIEYLWGYLNTATEEHNERFPTLTPFYKLARGTPQRKNTTFHEENRYKRSIAKKTSLNIATAKPKDKYKEIIYGFDIITRNATIKKQLMEELKYKWYQLKNNNEIKKWIEKNEELTDWAMEYVKKRFLENRIPYWLPSFNEENERKRREKIKLILSTIYNLMEPEENKLLMITLLSKAGTQQKFRMKSKKNKKTNVNIIISDLDKDKFDKIKSKRNLNSEETLSEIINFYVQQTHQERPFDIFSDIKKHQ